MGYVVVGFAKEQFKSIEALQQAMAGAKIEQAIGKKYLIAKVIGEILPPTPLLPTILLYSDQMESKQ